MDNKHRKPVQQQILKTTKTLISQWYLANNTYNVKNSTMGNLYLWNTCLQKEQIKKYNTFSLTNKTIVIGQTKSFTL